MIDNSVIVFKDLQKNRCSESGKYNLLEDGFDLSFVVSSASNRARVLPEFVNLQNVDLTGCTESSFLGLKLEISDSFLDLVNKKLCEGKQVDFSSHQNHGSYLNNRSKTRFDASESSQQKLKASNLAAVLLKIGSWQKHSTNVGDLTVKLYYAKRRMVWEILEGLSKSKIEIEWSDIMAIRAVSADADEPGILEIKLNKPPSFFRENNPQPRRHTSWAPVSDFTRGQATMTRRHLVVFPPGLLDKHYEKLLNCDERLFALSQLPFPDQESPLFDTTMFGPSQHSFNLNERRLGFESTFIRPSPNSTAPAMNYPSQSADNNPTVWDQGIDLPDGNVGIQEPNQVLNQWQIDTNSITQGQKLLSYQDYGTYHSKLDDSKNDLFGNNGQVLCSNEGTLGAEVEVMIQPYFNPTILHRYNNNMIETYMACDFTDNNLEWLPSQAPNEAYVGQESDLTSGCK